MIHYEGHLTDILRFTSTYEKLINCHLVDFITENLWDRCLPSGLKRELELNEIDDPFSKEYDTLPALNGFLKAGESLSLLSKSLTTTLDHFLADLPYDSYALKHLELSNPKDARPRLMSLKKYYEVEALGMVVASLTKLIDGLVVDAGAGKAYLSMHLAVRHKIPVLAIDSSGVCAKGAIDRQRKLKRTNNEYADLGKIQYAVEEIDDGTDYTKLVNHLFTSWHVKENLLLTGLHTCGSLAHSIIKSFLSTRDFKILSIIPCCYHLTSDTFGKSYSFSKNARMLAQQSLERTMINKKIPSHLFYRAVLQVLLRAMGLERAKVGRGGPTTDFPNYARWALLKAGIERSKVPSASDLELLYHSHAAWKKKFDIFQMMRIFMGPIVEASIILDRMVFLQNSGRCSKIALLRLFDPVVSPRCYAILAMK